MTSTNIRKLSHAEMDLYRKPLLPKTWSCFPVDREIDTQHLRKILQKDLDKIRSGAEKDPFSNSITMLALDISRRLEKNLLNYSALEALIQRLAVGSLGFRADKLKSYMGSVNDKENEKAIYDTLKSLGKIGNKKITFVEFNRQLGKEIFGIVLTAHPTFGMTYQIMLNLAKLATNHDEKGKKISDKELKSIIKDIFKTEQKPEKNISLDFEHELSIISLKNLQMSLNTFYRIVLKVAKELYPKEYMNVEPQVFRLHTWVGYDVDGRGDISWSNTFSKRLKVKLEQLKIYKNSLNKILKSCTDKKVNKRIIKLYGLISNSIKINEKVYKSFSDPNFLNDVEDVKKISNFLHKNKLNLITSSKTLIEYITDIQKNFIPVTSRIQNKTLDELIILKIEIKNFGLGLGRTQVRLNANQLNNAISKEIDLKSNPDDPSSKRTYLQAISKLIEGVKQVKINFGSVLEENMNARRYFMVIKQMFKYIDEGQSIRFLIAECDYALTAMTALYFAKLFGVDHKIDISPLFETEKGLTSGHEVISSLLKNIHYRKYIFKREKLCVQTGFSDAGRYLGQSAAVLSIENLQRKIAKILNSNNLSNVKLLIFNTHGESIGRGGHPNSLMDRLGYVNCNFTRKKLKEWGIDLIQEISFQGGDGYQYFMNHQLALASIARILEFCFNESSSEKKDSLYDSQDFGIEFVNTIKQFNTEIMDDPNYAALLNVFNVNLTHSTGSRAVKRFIDGSAKTLVYHPSQTRAIPQNAILQQLGMLANSLGGVGRFLRKNPKEFLKYYKNSDRFRKIMDIVKYSFAFSDIEVLKAYIDCFDPGMWLSWSTRTADANRSQNMKEVANLLENFDVHWRFNKVYRTLHQEYMEIRNWLLGRKHRGRIAVGRGRVVEKEIRDELLLMHGIRVAIIHEIFLLSVRIPKFSDQSGTSRDEVIAKLIRFDVLDAVETLRKIFPVGKIKTSNSGFEESSNYISETNVDYSREEKNIFKQLEALYECARRVSTGITHFIGAVG